jgi:hypothetical protein
MIEFSGIQNIYFILPLLGLVIGIFGTMTGGGGGFFFIPILTLIIGVPAQTAFTTSLVAALPICALGSFGHYRRRNIDLRLAAIFASFGIAGAFIGSALTNKVSSAQLKTGFGIYSLLIASNVIFSTLRKDQNKKKNKKQETQSRKLVRIAKGSMFGLAAGTVTGTFGTSGTAPVLAGLLSMRIPVKLVIGTSLLVVLVNTIFATGAHFLVGKIDMTLVCFLTTGSAIGALLGPKLINRIQFNKSENKVRYWYAAIMVVLGILMIIKGD